MVGNRPTVRGGPSPRNDARSADDRPDPVLPERYRRRMDRVPGHANRGGSRAVVGEPRPLVGPLLRAAADGTNESVRAASRTERGPPRAALLDRVLLTGGERVLRVPRGRTRR